MNTQAQGRASAPEKILVIGGAGYIGSACVAALVAAGHEVVVIDDFSTGQKDKLPAEVILCEGGIEQPEFLQTVFSAHTFAAVIHLAAKKAVGESEEKPQKYFSTNVTGTINILNAMAAHGVPKIIFSSTAALYAPSTNNLPMTEAAAVGPTNVYGRTKLLAEDCIKEYQRTGKISSYSILRYFNVAGDAGLNFIEQNAQNVFPILHTALTTGKPFMIFGVDYDTPDGTCVRDYIHLEDLVAGHLLALNDESNNTYNLGTGTGYSVRELVAMFEQVSGKTINVEEAPRRAGDAAAVTADATKAKQNLHWQPSRTLEDMVRSTLAS